MTILLDTNIILDYIAERQFYLQETKKIFDLIYSKKIKGVIAAHSITNLWYIAINHKASSIITRDQKDLLIQKFQPFFLQSFFLLDRNIPFMCF